MNKKPSVISALKLSTVIFGIVFMLPASGGVPNDMNFECAGKVDNGMVTFREFPTFHFSGKQLRISGSDIFSTYNFELCSENAALLSFATNKDECRANASPAANNSLKSAHGTLNKTSGQVDISGSQGLHGEYQCKASIKK